MKPILRFSIATLVLLALGIAPAYAQVNTEAINEARAKAVNFLKNSQNDNGSWTRPSATGITGVIATGLLDAGLSADDKVVAQALDFLKGFVHDDGGIYQEGSTHRNYETAIALMAFTRANDDGRYDDLIARATKFLKGLQWDKGEDIDKSDERFGGAGYGHSSRPDLSNTSFFVEALKDAGVSEDDPAMKKALVFISRCQNRESEYNTTEFATKINDGGFYYTVAAGGSSAAGETPNGGLRSYASMTYSGLKSMIYAGLDTEDPRAQAALDWAKKHYSVTQNPGLGEQGLFYYYQAFAKALEAMEIEKLTDAKGNTHDWRVELTKELLDRQNKNGSWVNSAERWFEGDPNLVTGYVLMTLNSVAPLEEDEED